MDYSPTQLVVIYAPSSKKKKQEDDSTVIDLEKPNQKSPTIATIFTNPSFGDMSKNWSRSQFAETVELLVPLISKTPKELSRNQGPFRILEVHKKHLKGRWARNPLKIYVIVRRRSPRTAMLFAMARGEDVIRFLKFINQDPKVNANAKSAAKYYKDGTVLVLLKAVRLSDDDVLRRLVARPKPRS
jgi:hypothetical protein